MLTHSLLATDGLSGFSGRCPGAWCRRTVVWLVVVGLFPAGLLVWGQEPGSGAGAAERIRFLSLEELDRREALLEIREKLLAGKGTWEAVSREAEGAFRRYREIGGLGSDDEKILAYVRLHRRTLGILDTLHDLNRDVLAVDVLVGEAEKEAEKNPSVLQYLGQARMQTAAVLKNCSGLQGRLHALAKSAKRRAALVPAPASFASAAGLTMRLVKHGADSFYVSDGPVSRGTVRVLLSRFAGSPDSGDAPSADSEPGGAASGAPATRLTWHSARRLCRYLSESERRVYRLPTIAELKALHAARIMPPVAVWSNTEWRHADVRERTMAERFGIKMVAVWDPAQMLSDEHLFPEFPFAEYPQIGFVVVTGTDTGRAARWARLKPRMDGQQ